MVYVVFSGQSRSAPDVQSVLLNATRSLASASRRVHALTFVKHFDVFVFDTLITDPLQKKRKKKSVLCSGEQAYLLFYIREKREEQSGISASLLD